MRVQNIISPLSIAIFIGGILPTQAFSAETISYTYDTSGGLVVAKSTGTINNNKTHSICYDQAGNRVTYDSNTTGLPATCVTQG